MWTWKRTSNLNRVELNEITCMKNYDLGLDEVQTLDPATLFRMLSDGQAELVTNALQGLIF